MADAKKTKALLLRLTPDEFVQLKEQSARTDRSMSDLIRAALKKMKIYIFQFMGYGRDIQVMLTDLLLWDLWNYSVKNGSQLYYQALSLINHQILMIVLPLDFPAATFWSALLISSRVNTSSTDASI